MVEQEKRYDHKVAVAYKEIYLGSPFLGLQGRESHTTEKLPKGCVYESRKGSKVRGLPGD